VTSVAIIMHTFFFFGIIDMAHHFLVAVKIYHANKSRCIHISAEAVWKLVSFTFVKQGVLCIANTVACHTLLYVFSALLTAWFDMIWYIIWYDIIYDMIWYMIWYDDMRWHMIRYDMVWYKIQYDIWYDTIRYTIWYMI
jgi:hypothetical protein